MVITFFDTEEYEKEPVRNALGSSADIHFVEKQLSPEDVTGAIAESEVLSVFIHSHVTKDVLERFPKLRHIATRSTGFDHIDLAATKGRGISVSTVPTYGARTVAEYAFALILALSRKAYDAYDRLRTTGETDVKDFEGFDLAGKTLGVIGTGHIGTNSIAIGKGFGMDVLAFDVHADSARAEKEGFAYVSLEELVSRSDIVTIHVPLLPATTHLINSELLSKFKKGSILINTSRGEVVDTKALVESLTSGTLSGAGLDVLEGERMLRDELDLLSKDQNDIEAFRLLAADHKLIDMPQVIVTPHIAFNTREAKHEILSTTIQNIQNFLSDTPKNIVSA